MKKLLGILIATVMTMTSQASTNLNGNVHYGKLKATATPRLTVTRSVPVRVKIQKPKIFVSKPFHRADDLDDDIDVDDIITSYRRRDLNKIEHEEGISDNIRWRLFLARQLAMLKHKQVWG